MKFSDSIHILPSLQGSFLIGAALLVSAISTIFSKKIENSIFSMIATFAFSGILFILIGVPFFGFIYLIVYTAAISILFLFVLMMLKIQDQFQSNDKYLYLINDKFILFSGLFSSLILYFLYGTFNSNDNHSYSLSGQYSANHFPAPSLSNSEFTSLYYHNEWTILSMDTMQSLAYVLYTEQVSLLILISIVLLIVMVGLINHLSQSSNKNNS